ncbi:hypothetical protein [Acinetobacter pittii]|uniref:hypothetical protein n=1 Tax=Acinetobacter pittii TaxID=48296 RepID=UPI0021CE67AE|nr:hypothetical protein [Acinetobacter pittii]MCU4561618.1 hypothetical protein [Acinetobacter pittii]
MENIDTKIEMERFGSLINELDRIIKENRDIYTSAMDISQNGEHGIVALLPENFYFNEYNLEELDQYDSQILNNLSFYSDLSNNLKYSFNKYQLVPYASLLNPKLIYDFSNYLTNLKDANNTCKEISRYSGLLNHELVMTNFEEVLKEKDNDKKDYILDLMQKIITHKKILYTTLPTLSLDFELAIQSFDLSIKNTLLFEREKQDNLSEFLERFKEETALLIKKYNTEVTSITEKYENKIKDYEIDIERLRKSSELMISGVDAGLKNLNELNDKSQKLEIIFSAIIKEKTTKIDEELEIERKNISSNIKDVKDALFQEEKQIRDAHQSFLTLVGNAGIYKLTENYNDKAQEEKKEYKAFRLYTTISIIAAIISTILIFIWALDDNSNSNYDFISFLWQPTYSHKLDYFLLLSRLSISLMFFVLAFYLSKQASKHYECYQENHRTFLQLAALEPFMEKIDKDDQKNIRKGLVPTYFNQNADGKFASNGEEITLPINIKEYAEKLIEVGKNLIEKSSDQSKSNDN